MTHPHCLVLFLAAAECNAHVGRYLEGSCISGPFSPVRKKSVGLSLLNRCDRIQQRISSLITIYDFVYLHGNWVFFSKLLRRVKDWKKRGAVHVAMKCEIFWKFSEIVCRLTIVASSLFLGISKNHTVLWSRLISLLRARVHRTLPTT